MHAMKEDFYEGSGNSDSGCLRSNKLGHRGAYTCQRGRRIAPINGYEGDRVRCNARFFVKPIKIKRTVEDHGADGSQNP